MTAAVLPFRLFETTRRSCEGLPHDPAVRGLVVQYHPGELNHCPGCSRKAWHVGRLLAECANERCATALPIAPGGRP